MAKPTAVFLDTFTAANSTALIAKATDTGPAWVRAINEGGSGDATVQSNALNIGTTAVAHYAINSTTSAVGSTAMIEFAITTALPYALHPGVNGTSNNWDGYFGGASNGAQTDWKMFRASGGSLSFPAGPTAFSTEVIQNDLNVVRMHRSGSKVDLLCNGVQVLTATDGTPLTTKNPILWISATTANNQVCDNYKVFNDTDEISILFIGDSIFNGAGAGVSRKPSVWIGRDLQKGSGGYPVRVLNVATNGTTTTDWAVAGGAYISAKASLAAQSGPKYMMINLGVNDSKVSGRLTKAQFKANISAMCADAVASSIKVILVPPTYFSTTSSPFDASSITFVQDYGTAMSELVNNSTIFLAGSTGFAYFQNNPSSLAADALHPNDTGNTAWAAILTTDINTIISTDYATGYSLSGTTVTGVVGSDSTSIIMTATGPGAFSGGQIFTFTSNKSTTDTIKDSTGGSGAILLSVTPTVGTTSFTIRINSSTTGNRLITVTNGQGWTDFGPITYSPISNITGPTNTILSPTGRRGYIGLLGSNLTFGINDNYKRYPIGSEMAGGSGVSVGKSNQTDYIGSIGDRTFGQPSGFNFSGSPMYPSGTPNTFNRWSRDTSLSKTTGSYTYFGGGLAPTNRSIHGQ